MNKKIKFWYFIDKHGDPWYCGLKPAWNDEIKDWETDPNDILWSPEFGNSEFLLDRKFEDEPIEVEFTLKF